VVVSYQQNAGQNHKINPLKMWQSSHTLSKNIKIKIYKTIILPVVLYGCETWSLTPWEEHRVRVFENRMLKRMLGLKRKEGARG
jgi:hypothetical protein